MFAFDRVLKPNVSQEYVYTVSAKPIVAGEKFKSCFSAFFFSLLPFWFYVDLTPQKFQVLLYD